MKRKYCTICSTKLKPTQNLFCSNECYEIGHAETVRNLAYVAKEKELLKKMLENAELEAGVLYTKKQNLILKESVNFDVPFIRIQEERYRKVNKTDNEGIVLPVDSDLIVL
jgi:hypothetical protein